MLHDAGRSQPPTLLFSSPMHLYFAIERGSSNITLLGFEKCYRDTISRTPNDLCIVCLREPVPTILNAVVLLEQPSHAVRHLGHL